MNEGETFIRWAFGGQEVQGGWNQRMTAYSGVQTLRTCWLSMTAPAPALHARTPICLPSNTPSSILSPGRPLFPSDLEQLKALHEACFPIQYEKHYFQNAVHGRAGMRSWAAIHPCRTSGDAEEARSQNQVVGFVIARVNSAWDLTPEEHVGLGLAPTDGTHLLYILTFGVHEKWRRRGLGDQLVQALVGYSRLNGLRCIYLHTLDQNEAAQRFYRHAGFVAKLEIPRYYSLAASSAWTDTDHAAILYALDVDVKDPRLPPQSNARPLRSVECVSSTRLPGLLPPSLWRAAFLRLGMSILRTLRVDPAQAKLNLVRLFSRQQSRAP
ncbi:hypothetical protein ACKKBG_A35125 [Auxenochlorella protothecoides x Auxenochlorella symbiontica]